MIISYISSKESKGDYSAVIQGNTYKFLVNEVYKCRSHQQLNHEDNTKPKHEVEAQVKRRLSHAMNLMPMSKIYFSRSVEIGSSHVKFYVLPLPINFSITSGASFIKVNVVQISLHLSLKPIKPFIVNADVAIASPPHIKPV